jgi:hypothetical protein
VGTDDHVHELYATIGGSWAPNDLYDAASTHSYPTYAVP